MADNQGTPNSSGGQGEKVADNSAGEQVSKAEFEKVRGDSDKMKQELEDLRMEQMSPEYLEFLASQSSKKEEAPKPQISDDEFSKMTPKQLYERAKNDALAEAKKEVDAVKKFDETRSKENVQKEIRQFATDHADFPEYKNLMHSLSLDPKNADLGLSQLYVKAKEYVKKLAGTPEDKAKANRAKGEKPGYSSVTYKKEDKKIDGAQAADEAWDEVVGESGLPGT